ncbi:hypothetical protein [Ornithinibacillus xuwenensis]|uniref:Uncharacterized protein n=1 Tax=Ornithinibacillus xuwenensis TaxID=3144668 RepID=A0ABU9XHI9_9BACI
MCEHVRNCKLCQKQMRYSAFFICKECLIEIDTIGNYIKKHPQVSVSQIAKATNLSTESAQKIITYMISRSTLFMM